MVKFAKFLLTHLVPEWAPAFCDYKKLKKELKRIKSTQGVECRSFDGTYVALRGPSLQSIRGPSPDEVIAVRTKLSKMHGSRVDLVETEMLTTSAQAESEKPFFASLDSELNKVIEFYKTKEKEFLDHAEILDQQMQALFELKLLVERRTAAAARSHARRLGGDEDSLTPLKSDDLDAKYLEMIDSVVLMHNEMLFQTIMNQKYTSRKGLPNRDQLASVKNQLTNVNGLSAADAMPTACGYPKLRKSTKDGPPLPPRVNPYVRSLSDNTGRRVSSIPERAKSTVTAQQFGAFKKKVQHSEKMLCEAFVEFYRGLGLLKTYSALNMLAFTKTLKKYEKVTEGGASSTYMRTVEMSYFNSSNKVVKLMTWTEGMFTDYFTKGNRHKARKALKPAQAKVRPQITFFLGMFTGCSLILVAAFATVVHVLFGSMSEKERADWESVYMTSVFPIFSMIVLLLLHMYVYGWNLYFWQRVRINYAFIFEFAPGTELSYQEVLLVSTALTVVLGGAMLGHLASIYNTSVLIDLIPLGLVLTVFGILFCPFHICYRSSRRFFLKCMWRIVCAPFYTVILADFFLGDQLCSQVPLLRKLEYVICYYGGGHFKTDDGQACLTNKLFLDVSYMIAVLPYWWRLLQCLRRYRDEGGTSHLVNGGKYLSALIVVVVRIQYGNTDDTTWTVLYVISSTFTTFYQIYWDLVCDWGLLRRKSVNPWLRDDLILEDQNYIYFLSMGLNVVLRFPWLLSITSFQFGGLDSHISELLLAALEVVRRGQWNFYRLENEHLNNVGHYRAIKTVPLPFLVQ